MKINRRFVLKAFLGVYIIISAGYIAVNSWRNFTIQYYGQAYGAGQTDTITALIEQAEDPACQPFYVYTQDKQVQLINTSCSATNTDEATSQ